MGKGLKRLVFDMWMDEHHPYFYMIFGILTLITGLATLISVLLIVFEVEWWWKSLIISVVAFFIVRVVNRTILLTYVDEFNMNHGK
jgi:hypothetical protein